ncbi:hypothetical protein SRDD_03780 [Serratia sp. DD3]|nr:hypothetical protein SRDD_03780 [Serratia sp. DD3]
MPWTPIPVILQIAWVLAVLYHPSHIVSYAPGDSITCRLQANRIILGIYGYSPVMEPLIFPAHRLHHQFVVLRHYPHF